jgi:hypothetical protein
MSESHDHGNSARLIIDLNIHARHDDDERDTKLDLILAQIVALSKQDKLIMSTVTSVKQLVTDLDAETTAVSAKVDAEIAEIARLSAIIAAGGAISQADLDAISDGLTPISERLKVLGSDVANPIPPAA